MQYFMRNVKLDKCHALRCEKGLAKALSGQDR